MNVEQINAENLQKVEERKHAYRRLFESEDGQTVLKDLENYCSFKRTTINKEYNAYQTFAAEGMRNVFLYILAKVERKDNE